ncbi:MAG: Rieske 2Fe-2S domain-containing protein [Armatimonadetes bacterium]|nr:Rieske 2Fe-2S domain-containing protein [Armatimonadota bacterium]
MAIQDLKPEPENTSRRDLFATAGWAVLSASIAGVCGAFVRFLSSNTVPEALSVSLIGRPDEYPVGSATFLEEHRVYLLRDARGFRALSAVCTHLGCTVVKDAARHGFRCPCHGSRFNEQGEPVVGPARRALAWHPVALSRDGRLQIDRGRAIGAGHYLALDRR